jgi:hypothetical protein
MVEETEAGGSFLFGERRAFSNRESTTLRFTCTMSRDTGYTDDQPEEMRQHSMSSRSLKCLVS